jgi:hypothetical protein
MEEVPARNVLKWWGRRIEEGTGRVYPGGSLVAAIFATISNLGRGE